mmetsp:Transcript_71603/g.167653  ORF Transcript_71603/g.167653 Transcript_71603/m.167653 type:complete len:270 (-) Transcript_71603:38-847(-)
MPPNRQPRIRPTDITARRTAACEESKPRSSRNIIIKLNAFQGMQPTRPPSSSALKVGMRKMAPSCSISVASAPSRVLSVGRHSAGKAASKQSASEIVAAPMILYASRQERTPARRAAAEQEKPEHMARDAKATPLLVASTFSLTRLCVTGTAAAAKNAMDICVAKKPFSVVSCGVSMVKMPASIIDETMSRFLSMRSARDPQTTPDRLFARPLAISSFPRTSGANPNSFSSCINEAASRPMSISSTKPTTVAAARTRRRSAADSDVGSP